MHTWCDHNAFRRDSDDPLVSDTRILLLLQAYLPNFWRTFLHYGQDSKEQIAPSHLEFPTGAQRSEMPPGQDTTMTATKAEVPKLFVTEASMLRCAEDFGLVPTVCSAKQVAKIFRSLATSQAKIDVFPPKGDGRSSPGGGGLRGRWSRIACVHAQPTFARLGALAAFAQQGRSQQDPDDDQVGLQAPHDRRRAPAPDF